MKWSWKIGEISGIQIYLHGTLLILLAWIGLVHYFRGNDLLDAVHGLVFVVALFGTVVLHELGHALAARRYGIATRDITLLPIGGVARLERMPDDPKQELVVALAGPAVNVVLAMIFFLAIQWLAGASGVESTIASGMNQLDSIGDDKGGSLSNLSELSLVGAQFLAKLLVVNVALAVFNLLPAFPMDGGRVLRALLAMRMDYVRATQVAAAIGQGMALLFGFVGLFSNPFLVFIALFVWMGAASESSVVQMRSALGGIPISRAMITDFRTIAPQDRLEDVAAHVIAGFQQDFPVTDHGQLVGMLTRSDLLKSLAEKGREVPVETVMRRDFQQADPSEMLEGMFERLEECDCPALPVVRAGELVGVINMENIGEFMALQSALRSPARAPA